MEQQEKLVVAVHMYDENGWPVDAQTIAVTDTHQDAINTLAQWIREQDHGWAQGAAFAENTPGVTETDNGTQTVEIQAVPNQTLVEAYFEYWTPEENYTIQNVPYAPAT